MQRPSPRNVVLIGFMGSGKSRVGRTLARMTGRTFVDTDAEVVEEAGPIERIFAEEGERSFRKRERRAVARAASERGAIIATGGGAALDDRNLEALSRTGEIVYLDTPIDVITARLDSGKPRPLLSEDGVPLRGRALAERIRALAAERRPGYEAVADHVVRARTSEAAAGRIVGLLSLETTMKSVHVRTDPAYRVHVGHGALRRLGELANLEATRLCVVSHPRIRRAWGEAVAEGLDGREHTWFTFPEGERNKTPATAMRLARHLASAGLHRDDALVALGGGVVGDLTGFVASTYARGIGVVQVPTSLLAMVDAAIGGKTGVDLPEGKNLVGTFHQPSAVVADLATLGTLPDRQLRAGLAEVVKYGFIADPPLAARVAKRADEIFERGAVLQPIVVSCAKIKAEVVALDPREGGRRAILNYGHTLGHALEAAGMHGRGPALHHGEAISVGMVFAAWVAHLDGRVGREVVDEHVAVLERLGLPTSVEGVAWKDVIGYMRTDKKFKDGLRMVLLSAPGDPVVERVEERLLQKAFRKVAT